MIVVNFYDPLLHEIVNLKFFTNDWDLQSFEGIVNKLMFGNKNSVKIMNLKT
jgi:hypothetical protein